MTDVILQIFCINRLKKRRLDSLYCVDSGWLKVHSFATILEVFIEVIQLVSFRSRLRCLDPHCCTPGSIGFERLS